MHAKNTLNFSNQGYALLDQKRKVLIREAISLTESAAALRIQLTEVLTKALIALQKANMEMGSEAVLKTGRTIPLDTSVQISARSLMGVEIPQLSYENTTRLYVLALEQTTVTLDEAFFLFNDVKEILIQLTEAENAAKILAEQIKKTSKRANALQNITIPKLETRVKYIQDNLEERERDEFTRMKMVKAR